MKKRIWALLGTAMLVASGFVGVSTVIDAQPAQAAGCTYSNLSSTKVKNVNCSLGAYGWKKTANATTGTRVGAWVAAGKYSYNPDAVCYVYPTMVKA